jgi:hypothetical protein
MDRVRRIAERGLPALQQVASWTLASYLNSILLQIFVFRGNCRYQLVAFHRLGYVIET